jgi:uncharacterized cupredoxin-like copper-binding protein
MTITDSSPTETHAGSTEPTGVGVGVWIFSSFLGLVAICISIAALVVALNHETPSTAKAAAPAPVKTATGADTVALREYNVSVTPPVVTAGTHDFTIANDGRTEHELLVFQTNLDPAAFPIDAEGDINEEAPGINKISDGDNIAPGGTQKRAVDLSKPGTYVFVCNLPGHFKAGMYQVVNVK